MKKILALAAVAALTAGVSAYAANPFSDVTADDWAYQAVSDLSAQGVVEGYPDGTFKGEKNMTRYELAQIVARLMAKEDQLNAEQQATIDKLAGEYADELANLGVRVANLEKKVGNISWSGDARMQYQHNLDGATKHKDSWNGRMRINVEGQVNDQVTVNGRFVTNMYFKNAEDDDGNTTMDRINAKWTPNDATYVTIGRQGVALDVTGTFWDEDGMYDGVTAGWDNGKVGIDAGYGYVANTPWDETNHFTAYAKKADSENWFAKLTGHIGETADVSAFYQSYGKTFNNFADIKGDDKAKVWGVGTSINLGSSLVLDGDYVQTQLSGTYNGIKVDNPALWTAGLTYGEVDTDKVGSWSLGVHYVDADMGSMLLGNTALDMGDQLDFANDPDYTKVKFWVAKAGVAVQKNVELDAYYNFAAKASGNNVEDPDDTWGIELNYAF